MTLYPIHRVPSPGYEIIETRAGGPFKKAIRNCLLALFGNFEHAIKPIKDLEAHPIILNFTWRTSFHVNNSQ